jgi:antibiotic biosynthesis monooxygenase (ABM) superfamily enzyme
VQLKDLLWRTVEGFVKLFDPKDQERLPIFKMELTFDDDKMEFYPTFQDLEDVVLSVVERISEALQVLISSIHHVSLYGSTSEFKLLELNLSSVYNSLFLYSSPMLF